MCGTIHDDHPTSPSPPADDLTTTTSEGLEVTTRTLKLDGQRVVGKSRVVVE